MALIAASNDSVDFFFFSRSGIWSLLDDKCFANHLSSSVPVPCLQYPTDPNAPPNIYPDVTTGLKEVNEVDLSWEKKRECVKEAI